MICLRNTASIRRPFLAERVALHGPQPGVPEVLQHLGAPCTLHRCIAPSGPSDSINLPSRIHNMRSSLVSHGSVIASAVILAASCSPAAAALELHAEPANALSLPTWAIHVSSVAEWVTAMVSEIWKK